MKVLVINSGSSSIKYVLFEMQDSKVLTKGIVERIGEASAEVTHSVFLKGEEVKEKYEREVANHVEGLEFVVHLLTDSKKGIIHDKGEIVAVGHRVVHGGEHYNHAVVVNDEVKARIEELIPLAPLHNPANLQGIEVAEKIFPEAIQVAVFDTAFHQTMPAASYRYPLPNELYEKEKIRAYGMHGTSHEYVSKQALHLIDKPVDDSAIITIHLGNGCSMAAIKGGKCVDTSMGLSPLAGLMMGTRTGDIDPSIPFYLGSKLNMSFAEIDQMLNKESGLKGIAGSNDMRDVLDKRSAGDKEAMLAIDMYVQRIKKYIGAYIAEMGGLDAIVFTAGIGENSDEVRRLVCEDMAFLGIDLDEKKNRERKAVNRSIHAVNSKVQVWVVPTNEELEIASQSRALLGQVTQKSVH
ncbi:acetate/propionate family kinase [Marinoscillum sp. MHG1-6]|uniref:acetate/propionate family kinase n=1 Tax=Marinoscillum sp. MHG1-6 TaxID=2959627 RepID=UPI002157FD29|nr:acetate kinase [Marinoscillum sp. MHG1-6]